jgi:hypothetical protein
VNATQPPLHLTLLNERFAVCQLPEEWRMPPALWERHFLSATRTPDETSVVVPESLVTSLFALGGDSDFSAAGGSAAYDAEQMARARIERNFACMKVNGQLDFGLVGILARLTGALAQANVPVFAISTFNTDYLLVRAPHLEAALAALEKAGCLVQTQT